ncbi:MAG TPA: carboxymuconolactone decarboxylase family protein [Gammaproteobacteria bacterium]|nr:carboxymuconolactone decarboxylase family protein [Gammaproteobacteria bacterium]
MDTIVGREDSKIPPKYRELIALAVAHATQCVYCIQVHAQAAKKGGPAREEGAETFMLPVALRAGGRVAHGTLALKLYNEAKNLSAAHSTIGASASSLMSPPRRG